MQNDSSPLLPWAIGLLKLVAILVGLSSTLLSLMALVGLAAESGWVRAGVALVLAFIVPMFVADRLLPADDSKPMPGLISDVFSLVWLAFGFLMAVPLHGASGPWLAREGDRLASAGHETMAGYAYLLAGVEATSPAQAEPPASASASASASSSASAPSSASASASASPPTPGPSGSAPTPGPSASPQSPVDAGAPPPGDAGAASPDASAPLGRERTPAELFRDLAPSVVTIFVKTGELGEGSGTGFLIDREGTIATNHHVIGRGTSITVKFQNGAKYTSADVLADSQAADLALLRLDLSAPAEGKRAEASPLTLGDSDAVVVGERAISIGNPLGLEHTLTDGLVSARRIYENRAWIQMSVPVSPGNSGGPIFNMRGEVIGVTTQQVLGGVPGRAQNLNLAVPINELKKLIQPSYPSRRRFGERVTPGQW